MSPRPWVPIIAVAALGASACAAAAEPAAPAPVRLEWNARLRHEHVDDAAFAHAADASTLRLRGGLRLAWAAHWSALLEGEAIVADDGHYNSGANGRTAWPAVIDPPGAELNQAWLGWHGAHARAVLGRQRLLLDNQRWVGNVGWRQNEQTYDGGVLNTKPLDGTELVYAYFHNVNSVLFTNFPAKTHLINASYSPAPWLKVSAYEYLIDFAVIAGNRQDSETTGVRLAGTPELTPDVKLLYAAEFARQGAHADAPDAVKGDYALGEAGSIIGPATLKVGYEVLGSNAAGTYGVQTPLATLHAFDGWADQFLVTPATGLRRAYASAAATLGATALTVVYHEFSADFGGADYGTEIDASIGYSFNRQFAGLAKFASYDAESFATDTDKGWLQLEYKF